LETLGELCDKFTNRRDLARATRAGSTGTLRLLTNAVGRDRLLQNIGKAALQAWLDAMTCKPVSRASYLRTVRGMFRWAVTEKLIQRDPTEGVIAVQKHEREQHVIRPWMQHHDWQAFLDGCQPIHRIRAEFALHTGLRAGELMAARWDWLHATVGRPALTVPRMKSKVARAIPLDERAQACLAEARKKWPDSQYIFSAGGEGQGNLRARNVMACEKAKLPPVDFHGLRRSAGARWLELGASILEVSRLLGQ
jgi:integrase